MVKLYLMASHGYPSGPGIVFHPDQNIVVKDCQPYFLSQGARQEITRPSSLNLRPYQHEEPWKRMSGASESNQFVKTDLTTRTPVLIDVQDTRPDSVLFSFGIVEQCKRHEKILQFLMSRSNESERGELDLSVFSDLMGFQALTFDVHQEPYATPLVYPSSKFDASKSLVDFVGDLAHSSKITVHPDGRVLLSGSGKEVKDILSIISEFYLSKNSTMWRKQSLLVPEFSRLDTTQAHGDFLRSSLTVKDLTATPLKSPEKVKLKPRQKKKNSKKGGRERDLYKRNYFHACESLLSLMLDKKQYGKTAILSLKKSGSELPELLTHFSAGIAGTGLALLFSVVCKVAGSGVPFCASELFSIGFGFGLVWLSWAVNGLRDTIVYISKKASKVVLKDEEMMSSVDKSLHETYFRAAALMAVAALRVA